MSQTTHTPGPWEVEKPAEVWSGDTFVCRPYATKDRIGGMQFGECLANARLIAAAPELLAACNLGLKVAESWIHDQLDGTKFLADALAELDSVRSAIAKATN